MKTVIFDIDGTLADDSHRIAQLNIGHKRKDYDAYNDLMHLDTPKKAVVDALRGYHAIGHTIFLVTGRFGRYRKITEAWLAHHNIPFQGLIMRNDKDYRCGTVVKREELYYLRRKGYDVVAAFEDRNKLIEMFRDEGIICFAVENRDQ